MYMSWWLFCSSWVWSSCWFWPAKSHLEFERLENRLSKLFEDSIRTEDMMLHFHCKDSKDLKESGLRPSTTIKNKTFSILITDLSGMKCGESFQSSKQQLPLFWVWFCILSSSLRFIPCKLLVVSSSGTVHVTCCAFVPLSSLPQLHSKNYSLLLK